MMTRFLFITAWLVTSHCADIIHLTSHHFNLSDNTQWIASKNNNNNNHESISCNVDIESLCIYHSAPSLYLIYNDQQYNFYNDDEWSIINAIHNISIYRNNDADDDDVRHLEMTNANKDVRILMDRGPRGRRGPRGHSCIQCVYPYGCIQTHCAIN